MFSNLDGGGIKMKLIYFFFSIAVAMVGYTIHGSVFWSVVDFFFPLFASAKWLIYEEVTLEIIKETFAFFM
jgi:hypothetical protein